MNDLTFNLPKLLSGRELKSALERYPTYNKSIMEQDTSERLMALADIYNIYYPLPMSTEIYLKIYMSVLRSLKKKLCQDSIVQRNNNAKYIMTQNLDGIIGGADSYTIIGASGIGKSLSIARAIQVIGGNNIITVNKPFMKIIPCLIIQCPFDCSVKGMLLEMIRKADEVLGTSYSINATHLRATIDVLIGVAAQVLLNHVGLLVIDEIQNVVEHKNGRKLFGVIMQLTNCSGISICMVGTPECLTFFNQKFQLARRSVGLQYTAITDIEEFTELCIKLSKYCYTQNPIKLTAEIIKWLFTHTGGVISTVVALFHDAQEFAILYGSETVTLKEFKQAYDKRMKFLHPYMGTLPKVEPIICGNKHEEQSDEEEESNDYKTLVEIRNIAADIGEDILDELSKYITIERIKS